MSKSKIFKFLMLLVTALSTITLLATSGHAEGFDKGKTPITITNPPAAAGQPGAPGKDGKSEANDEDLMKALAVPLKKLNDAIDNLNKEEAKSGDSGRLSGANSDEPTDKEEVKADTIGDSTFVAGDISLSYPDDKSKGKDGSDSKNDKNNDNMGEYKDGFKDGYTDGFDDGKDIKMIAPKIQMSTDLLKIPEENDNTNENVDNNTNTNNNTNAVGEDISSTDTIALAEINKDIDVINDSIKDIVAADEASTTSAAASDSKVSTDELKAAEKSTIQKSEKVLNDIIDVITKLAGAIVK